MGLVDDIGHAPRPANGFQRLQRRIAATRAGGSFYALWLDPTDVATFRASGGRFTIPGLMAGMPPLLLSTTGAKTGQTRTSPVVGVPLDGDLAVLGTNFGRPRGFLLNAAP